MLLSCGALHHSHKGIKRGQMIHIKRIASEIKTIGLYDAILQDALKLSNRNDLSEREIEHLLIEHPKLLESYKQINLDYNISNIHLRDIASEDLRMPEHRDVMERINRNLAVLRENEKYTIDFGQSSTLITIMSIEFFVLFSVQYFIVLLDMKAWQIEIYALFLLSIVVAWYYSQNQKKLYHAKKEAFETLYADTLSQIEHLETVGGLKKESLFMDE